MAAALMHGLGGCEQTDRAPSSVRRESMGLAAPAAAPYLRAAGLLPRPGPPGLPLMPAPAHLVHQDKLQSRPSSQPTQPRACRQHAAALASPAVLTIAAPYPKTLAFALPALCRRNSGGAAQQSGTIRKGWEWGAYVWNRAFTYGHASVDVGGTVAEVGLVPVVCADDALPPVPKLVPIYTAYRHIALCCAAFHEVVLETARNLHLRLHRSSLL